MNRLARAARLRTRDRLKWAVLGSVYVHLAAGGLTVLHDVVRPTVRAKRLPVVEVALVDRAQRKVEQPAPQDQDQPDAYVRVERDSSEPDDAMAFAARSTTGNDRRELDRGRSLVDRRKAGQLVQAQLATSRPSGAQQPGAGESGDGPVLPEADDQALGEGRMSGLARGLYSGGITIPDSHLDLRVDPIPELREALGIAPIDRSDWPNHALSDTEHGGSADDGGIRYERVSSRETPLGRYMTQVEALLYARWTQQDLDLGDRAMGIQGAVAVAYRIQRNGEITDRRIIRSSGNVDLDRIALHALPERLPRIPRAVGADALEHKVTLTYNNPLIFVGGR